MPARAPIRLPGRKWLIGTTLAALVILAYLWAGYVLAPRLIRSEADRWAGRHAGVSLDLGPIKVDPVHFTVSVRDVRLIVHGRPLASLGRLFIGISPLSLLESSYHITALDLDHPAVHVVIAPDGTVNLAALLAPAGHSTGPTPVFRIDDLRIDQGELSLTDLGRSPAARTTLAPITLRLVNLRTRGGPDGRFVLEAQGEGAILAWQGRVSMSPFASHGSVSLSGLEAGVLAQFLPPALPLTLSAGQMSLSTQYAVAYVARGLATRLSALDFAATGLAVRGAGLPGMVRIARIEANSGELRYASGAPASGSLPVLTLRGVRLIGTGPATGQTVRLARLTLKGAGLDERTRRLAVSSLALAGLRLPVRRSRSGRISLMRFLPPRTPRGARSVSAPPGAHRAAWQIELGHFALTDARATVEDQTVSPAARFAITVHSFTATSLSNDLGRTVPFSVRASIDRAYLALDGRVTPASRDAAVWVSLAPLSLRTFAPYLPLAPSVQLHSGELGVRGFAEFAAGRLVRLSGRADTRDVRLLDRAADSGLFGWRDLTLTGVEYRPAHLVIGLARLTAPTGLIEILPNRTLNLAALAPPRTHAGARPARASPAHAAPSGEGAPAFAALLRRLDIENGTITFADESIKPHFRAPIDDLHGTIGDVSTSKTGIAHIDLAGQVIDRYSPVSVKGSFNPYGLGRRTDIRVTFDNIQLPIFDPYSDFYAGYAIAKGMLSTRFHYRIVNRELKAEHHIVIDQLQWGGPSGSTHRVGWPIRLATALLKNRAGVIRINLPVSGSLNDPSFDVWPVVWMMLRHLLEKAALAPFDLIGRLFAGAQQAQYIVFAPGSTALTPGAGASLSALAHALAERPGLQVDIPAGAAGPEDALALEDERIDALALAHLHRAPAGGIGALSLTEQKRLLAALYRAKLGRRPVYPAHLPAEPAAAAAAPQARGQQRAAPNARVERQRGEIRWLRERLRATVRPSAEALIALGLARARRVQDALLAHGIVSANRVFLTSAASGAVWHGRIRLKLQLH
jgi:hypothetical protein